MSSQGVPVETSHQAIRLSETLSAGSGRKLSPYGSCDGRTAEGPVRCDVTSPNGRAERSETVRGGRDGGRERERERERERFSEM